jgi:hypothetical protein
MLPWIHSTQSPIDQIGFHVRNDCMSSIVDPWASVSYFQKGAPEQVCAWRHMGRLLEYDHRKRPSTKKKYYPEPIIQVCHFCASGFWRTRETKITNTELNWLHSALIAKWPIDPTHLWSTGGVVATSSSEDIGSGCYLSMLTISLKPGITRNPNHLLPGTSLGIYEGRKI